MAADAAQTDTWCRRWLVYCLAVLVSCAVLVYLSLVEPNPVNSGIVAGGATIVSAGYLSLWYLYKLLFDMSREVGHEIRSMSESMLRITNHLDKVDERLSGFEARFDYSRGRWQCGERSDFGLLEKINFFLSVTGRDCP